MIQVDSGDSEVNLITFDDENYNYDYEIPKGPKGTRDLGIHNFHQINDIDRSDDDEDYIEYSSTTGQNKISTNEINYIATIPIETTTSTSSTKEVSQPIYGNNSGSLPESSSRDLTGLTIDQDTPEWLKLDFAKIASDIKANSISISIPVSKDKSSNFYPEFNRVDSNEDQADILDKIHRSSHSGYLNIKCTKGYFFKFHYVLNRVMIISFHFQMMNWRAKLIIMYLNMN